MSGKNEVKKTNKKKRHIKNLTKILLLHELVLVLVLYTQRGGVFVPSNTKATTLTRRAFLLLSRDDDGRTKKRRLYAAKKQNVYGSILGEFPL